MIAGNMTRQPAGRGGQTMVEFSIVAFLLSMLLLSVVETGRMILVYTTVANAARAGARYAIVHGGSRTGAGADGPSGPGNNPAQVVTVVKNFASAGLLTGALLVITIAYPAGSNAPGQPVNVTVVYPYDPLTTWLPFSVRLGSTTQGVIAF
jgi:Flp pilus assembly protein TadG